MIDLRTIEGLYQRQHELHAYCRRCARWQQIDLSKLTSEGAARCGLEPGFLFLSLAINTCGRFIESQFPAYIVSASLHLRGGQRAYRGAAGPEEEKGEAMKRIVLALLTAGVSVIASAAPQPTGTQNVNVVGATATVPVSVTNSSTSPVNVAVVNGSAPQAVNVLGSLEVTTTGVGGLTLYTNTGTFPVMLTTLGISAMERCHDTMPARVTVVIRDAGYHDKFSFQQLLTEGPYFSGYCAFSALFTGGLVVGPGLQLFVTVEHPLDPPYSSNSRYFSVSASGYVMDR